jgi:spore germination protein
VFSRIFSIALIVFLAVGFVGTGYWGYQEHQEKNAILIQAENNYQRAFHNLNNNITNIEDELGKSIAINSRKQLAPCMANIWRLASHARSNVGQLPLNLIPFSETEKLLAKISDFTYGIGMRDIENEPLTDKEWKQLKSLHSQAEEIQGSLRKIQTEMIEDQVRWMDVELLMASDDKDMDKSVIDGFVEIDKSVQGYIETDWGATDNQHGDQLSDKKAQIEGTEISSNEAKQKVVKFLNLDKDVKMKVEKNGNAREYSSYTVLINRDNDNMIWADVSRKGGYMLSFMNSRDIEESSIGLGDAEEKALSFLKERGITSMVSVESNQYDNVGVFDFVFHKDNIRIYTDLVRVKVALDKGEIIGYEGLDYVVAHDKNKKIPKPKLTEQDAKAKVNKNVKIHESYLSMVEIEGGEIKLCYELLGTIENETYRIFINAMTGDEEKIEKMKQAEPLV